jgi:hypothetical protein
MGKGILIVRAPVAAQGTTIKPAIFPLPLFAGEEGPKPKAWEVRVFSDLGVQTLTSHRSAAGPSSPVKDGRG